MIGATIKNYLIEHGISQSFLSKKTRYRKSVVNAMLNENRNITAEEYFLICNALGVPLDTFREKFDKETNKTS